VRTGEVRLPIAGALEDGEAVVVASEDPPRTLRTLLSWTRRHGLPDVEDLNVAPSSLEDAYLALVSSGEP
jgi:hypothetical protein